MKSKMAGKIKWFELEKGYGYIIGYDEETYYFEVNSLLMKAEEIKKGLEVKFYPNNFTNIPFAYEVEFIEKNISM